MKTRTDVHRPSEMDPAEYVFVGVADDHPGDSYLEVDHATLAHHGVETGTSDRYSHDNVPFYDARDDGRPNYRCHHCGKHGSNIRYFCFFLHKPTKKVVVVGQICAKKFNLGSRDQLNFQKRADEFRRIQARGRWVNDHLAEYTYLKAYDEQHAEDGWYSEFFESLWNTIQSRGHLSEAQVTGLNKWMGRGQPWEKAKETIRPNETRKLLDGDRHLGEVTRVQDEPTEPQIVLINDLANQLDVTVDIPPTRLGASNLINDLKAKILSQREETNKATERQITTINSLMDSRIIPLEDRRQARQMLDQGLTKSQASRWISRLLELPKIEASR